MYGGPLGCLSKLFIMYKVHLKCGSTYFCTPEHIFGQFSQHSNLSTVGDMGMYMHGGHIGRPLGCLSTIFAMCNVQYCPESFK